MKGVTYCKRRQRWQAQLRANTVLRSGPYRENTLPLHEFIQWCKLVAETCGGDDGEEYW